MHPRQVTAAASRSGASPGAMPTVTLSPATVDATVATPRMPGSLQKKGDGLRWRERREKKEKGEETN